MYNTDTLRHVSVSTVKKFLKKYGLRNYTVHQKPFLTLSQRRRILTWTKTYGTWDTNRWNAIVFIQSYSSTKMVRIRRTSNEKYNITLSQPVMKHWPKIYRLKVITDWISCNHTLENTIFSDEKRFSLDGLDCWMTYQVNQNIYAIDGNMAAAG